MADFEWNVRPERASLRRAVRHALRDLDPGLRIVAEDFLSVRSRMDLLGVAEEGEIVSVRIGLGTSGEELLTRALADLAWLRPRAADLLKLVPGLGIEPSAEPRALLLSPDFDDETRAAVENLPLRTLELIGYRAYRQHGGLGVVLEPCKPRGAALRSPRRIGSEPEDPTRASRPTGFRTGLRDEDLRVEPEPDPRSGTPSSQN